MLSSLPVHGVEVGVQKPLPDLLQEPPAGCTVGDVVPRRPALVFPGVKLADDVGFAIPHTPHKRARVSFVRESLLSGELKTPYLVDSTPSWFCLNETRPAKTPTVRPVVLPSLPTIMQCLSLSSTSAGLARSSFEAHCASKEDLANIRSFHPVGYLNVVGPRTTRPRVEHLRQFLRRILGP